VDWAKADAKGNQLRELRYYAQILPMETIIKMLPTSFFGGIDTPTVIRMFKEVKDAPDDFLSYKFPSELRESYEKYLIYFTQCYYLFHAR